MLFSPQTNTLKRSNYLAVFSRILTSTSVCLYPIYLGDVLLHLACTGGHVTPRTYIEPFSDSSSLSLPSMLSACSWHAQAEASLLICSGIMIACVCFRVRRHLLPFLVLCVHLRMYLFMFLLRH